MSFRNYFDEADEAQSKRDMKKAKDVLVQELEDARLELKQPPEWGHCRRGCAPSYLDRAGFCSPACHLGAPKGKFVTVGVVLLESLFNS